MDNFFASLAVSLNIRMSPEVVYYLPMLCEERKVPYCYVKKRSDLGSKVGISHMFLFAF